MILVDSNILIDYYRDRNSELAKKIDSMQIGVCGVVKSEVLHGAKNYDEVDIILHIKELIRSGLTEKEAIKEVAKLHKLQKQEVYKKYMEVK